MEGGAWKAAVHGITEGRTQLSDFTFSFHFHALEKEMAPHSSILAWRILGMGEPGGLPSMGWHRVGHDWSDLAAAAASSLSIMSSKSLLVVSCVSEFHPFWGWIIFHMPCFIYSSVGRHLDYFHTLAIMNNTAMNNGVQISLQVPAFNFFRYIPRSGIVGSYENSSFKFLRNYPTVFHSCCTM